MDSSLRKRGRETVLNDPGADTSRPPGRRKRRKRQIECADALSPVRRDAPHDPDIEECASRREIQECEILHNTVTEQHERATASTSGDEPPVSGTPSPPSLYRHQESDCEDHHNPREEQIGTPLTPLPTHIDATGEKHKGSAFDEATSRERRWWDQEPVKTGIKKYDEAFDPRFRSIIRRAVYHVHDDILGPSITPPSEQVTPPPDDPWTFYNPKFGDEVRSAYKISSFVDGIRRNKYGEEIASRWKRGFTPEEEREKWKVLRAKMQAELDELSDD